MLSFLTYETTKIRNCRTTKSLYLYHPPLSVSVLQNGDTALHIASFHEKFEIFRALIERGAFIDAVNLVGSTHPLCWTPIAYMLLCFFFNFPFVNDRLVTVPFISIGWLDSSSLCSRERLFQSISSAFEKRGSSRYQDVRCKQTHISIIVLGIFFFRFYVCMYVCMYVWI